MTATEYEGPPAEEILTPPEQEPPDPDAANFLPRAEDDPFPIHCLPPVMREVVVTVCQARRVPASLAGPVALACHAASLGAGLQMPTNAEEDRFTHPNLYVVTAARSGSGKGQAFDLLKEPLEKWEQAQRIEWEKDTNPKATASLLLLKRQADEILKTTSHSPANESRLAELQRKTDEAKALQKQPRVIAADATSAALAGLISAAPGHALASLTSEPREAVRILQGLFREGQSDDSLFLTGYSVESYRRDRRGANGFPESLNLKPCLCLCWSPQPDQLREVLANPSLREGGFVPRCLLLDTGADAQEEPDRPSPLDKKALADWEKLLTSHLRDFRQVVTDKAAARLKVAPIVFPLMRVYGNRLVRLRQAGGRFASISPQFGRVAENAWRLMLNLHAAKHGPDCLKKVVAETTARDAVELSEWFTRQLLALLLPELVRADEKRLEDLTQAVGSLENANKPPSLGNLRDRHCFTKEEVQRLARLFPGRVVISEGRKATRGPIPLLVSVLDPPMEKRSGRSFPGPF